MMNGLGQLNDGIIPKFLTMTYNDHPFNMSFSVDRPFLSRSRSSRSPRSPIVVASSVMGKNHGDESLAGMQFMWISWQFMGISCGFHVDLNHLTGLDWIEWHGGWDCLWQLMEFHGDIPSKRNGMRISLHRAMENHHLLMAKSAGVGNLACQVIRW